MYKNCFYSYNGNYNGRPSSLEPKWYLRVGVNTSTTKVGKGCEQPDTPSTESSPATILSYDKIEPGWDRIIGENKLPSTQNNQKNSENSIEAEQPKPRLRLDIVKKTIFRFVKKYYMDSFKAFYDYKLERKFCKGSEILEKAKVFVNQNIGWGAGNDTHVFMVALIDINNKYAEPDPKYPQLATHFGSLIRAYNNDRAKTLLSTREFANLVIHVLENETAVQQLLDQKEGDYTKRVYLRQIEMIKKMCRSTLSK